MDEQYFPSDDVKRVRKAISQAVQHNGWLAVAGPIGVGKTTSVTAALAGMRDVRVVAPLNLDREQLSINTIIEATIRDLSDERQRGSREARARQWRRIVGELAAKHRVIILLEEAHKLNRCVLTACKRLREIDWAGRSPLVSILLVGQPLLEGRLRKMREVGLRVRTCRLQGLSAGEVRPYLAWHGISLSDRVAEEMGKATREPLALLRLAEEVAEYTALRGAKTPSVADVLAAGATSLAERVRRLQVSHQQLSQLSGMGKSTINGILRGNYPGNSPRQEKKLMEAVGKLEGEQGSKAG